MTPPKLLLLTAGLFLLGGGLLVAATAGSRGLAACAIGLFVGAAALAMQLSGREFDSSPEEQRAANGALEARRLEAGQQVLKGERRNPKTASYHPYRSHRHKLRWGLGPSSRQAFTNQDLKQELWWV